MAKLISKTYGDALFDVAMESGKIDEFLEETEALKVLLKENDELVKLMNHPKVPKEEKLTVLESCFSNGISKETLGIMRLMVTKDRFNDIDSMLTYFVTRVKDYKNIGLATVTSAIELSDEEKSKIKNKLLETTDYVEFEIDYVVDESIIGGLVIRIKDRVVDSSIKTKIQKLSRTLSDIQLKRGECAE